MAVKHTMVEPSAPEIAAATARENAHFAELMGAQANAAALADFNDKALTTWSAQRDACGLHAILAPSRR